MIENHDKRKMPGLEKCIFSVECRYYHMWGLIRFALPVNVTQELH